MKIRTDKTNAFKAFDLVITIESKDEANALLSLFNGHNKELYKYMKSVFLVVGELSEEKYNSSINSDGLYNAIIKETNNG